MKEAWSIVIPFITIFIINPPGRNEAQDDVPQVKIITPDEKKVYSWNEQVKYTIRVSDSKDGDSKYGEIPPNECSLTVTYVPADRGSDIKEIIGQKEDPGLLLMKKSTCFGCHAHKTRLAGPGFQEIAMRYENNEGTIKSLSSKILNGSVGTWGDQPMPAHEELTEEQGRQISAFILKIGDDPNLWIYPGLEGTFRIIDKPKADIDGIYVLKASYRSTSGKEGMHSIALRIQ
jgi:cytochrome c